MSDAITPEKLKELLDAAGMKQRDLRPILDLTDQKISNIFCGARRISDAEQKLLRLYFYGEMPFGLPRRSGLESVLEFTEEEWRLIGELGKKDGYQSERAWIVEKIRAYLENNPRARETAQALKKQGSGV